MKLKYTFVFIVPLLGLINFNVSAHFDPIKIYPIGNSVVAQNITDYGIDSPIKENIIQNINYSEVLNLFKDKQLCRYMTYEIGNKEWLKFCKKYNLL